MAFENFNDFMTMCYVAPIGDIRCHGSYVWVAYGLAAVIVAANIIVPIIRKKQLKQTIQRKIKRENIQIGESPE